VLHGASHPEHDYPLYAHLEDVLAPRGIAVQRYDRRPSADGHDVPLAVQADDALAALRTLPDDVPVGLWGWSQGAWAALVAAHRRRLDFLVLVSACGVSPSRQMLYGTAEQLRRNGFGTSAIDSALAVRRVVDGYPRGTGSRAAAQAAVDAVADEAWFPLAGLRRQVPAAGAWRDMDFDPAPLFASVPCPTLALYGEDDEWVPVDESVAAFHGAPRVTVRRLAGSGHEPVVGPVYTDALTSWLDAVLP
jgi:pimeloyl-ACP methyl ester carboxylesterase